MSELSPKDIGRDVDLLARLTRKTWEVESYIRQGIAEKGVKIPTEEGEQSSTVAMDAHLGFGVFLAKRGVAKELDAVVETHTVFDARLQNHIAETGGY